MIPGASLGSPTKSTGFPAKSFSESDMSNGTGVLGRHVRDTPIAVIDFETTGLTPGYDRAVEVCIVRVNPGQA
jgi:DNA polymerase III epsilon subunit-like protein